jgi:hypothetical protein
VLWFISYLHMWWTQIIFTVWVSKLFRDVFVSSVRETHKVSENFKHIQHGHHLWYIKCPNDVPSLSLCTLTLQCKSIVTFHTKQQWHVPATMWSLMTFLDRWWKNSTCVTFLNICIPESNCKDNLCSLYVVILSNILTMTHEHIFIIFSPSRLTSWLSFSSHLYSSLWYLCCYSINYCPEHKPAMYITYNKWCFQYTHTHTNSYLCLGI